MSGIELTAISVQPVKAEQFPLIGFCRIVLNGEFVINGIRIVQGKAGVFISFPREYNNKTGEKAGICYPIKKELTDKMTREIMAVYNNEIGSAQKEIQGPTDIIRQEY